MPFDAGLTAAVTKEISDVAVGARIDKIYQPEKDVVILVLKCGTEYRKLLLSAVAGMSRFGFTEGDRENPASPPMFCMLLRKHLVGGHIMFVKQLGFERAVEIGISSHDEMGFKSEKSLVVEIMGTYSNIILLDEKRKVLSAIRYVDLSVKAKRQILPGFLYELPPVQEGKLDTLVVPKEEFLSKLARDIGEGFGENAIDKYLIANYRGLSPLIAREISYRASKQTSCSLISCDSEKLWFYFNEIYGKVQEGIFEPYILYDKDKKPLEYSFCEIRQYGLSAICVKCESFGELLDKFCFEKDKNESIKRKSQDILRLLSSASARITKKISLQEKDLAECSGRDKLKLYGDLITAYMYMLKKGDSVAKLVDYNDYDEDGNGKEVEVPLEINLTPAQNAQKYYKQYAKAKTREIQLTSQIKSGRQELEYIDTIFDSLTRAEGEKDITEIREELAISGYGKKLEAMFGSRTKSKNARRQKMKKTYDLLEFKSSGGYRILCGKNNLQNDYLTCEIADKFDMWFHVKGMPGSHTVMLCGKEEPSAEDYTEAATIAAFYSKGKDMPGVPVDYTRIKNVKKPSGAKPGYVIYETNYTAYITADEETVNKLKCGK